MSKSKRTSADIHIHVHALVPLGFGAWPYVSAIHQVYVVVLGRASVNQNATEVFPSLRVFRASENVVFV